jgi:hypothetical protein
MPRAIPGLLAESLLPKALRRRDGRVAEGARLESVFRGNSNVGSNPTLSAILLKLNMLRWIPSSLSGMCFLFGVSDMQFCRAPVRSVKA